MSKWDILDAFHRCNLHLSDFGKFIYVVPTLPADPSVLPCINMVLPMVWLNSPDFFCATSETVAYNANSYTLDPPPPLWSTPPPPHGWGVQDLQRRNSLS